MPGVLRRTKNEAVNKTLIKIRYWSFYLVGTISKSKVHNVFYAKEKSGGKQVCVEWQPQVTVLVD